MFFIFGSLFLFSPAIIGLYLFLNKDSNSENKTIGSILIGTQFIIYLAVFLYLKLNYFFRS